VTLRDLPAAKETADERNKLCFVLKKQHKSLHSPHHCCNLSPKAGTSHLRYHSVPVGFGAGVHDVFSSAKVIETRKGAEFRLVSFSGKKIPFGAFCRKRKTKRRTKVGRERTLHLADETRRTKMSEILKKSKNRPKIQFAMEWDK